MNEEMKKQEVKEIIAGTEVSKDAEGDVLLEETSGGGCSCPYCDVYAPPV